MGNDKTNNEEEKKGSALKELKLNDGKFHANGRDYFIDSELSADRFYKMQELSYDLGFGMDYKDFYDNLKTLYELMNELKFADAAILIHNMMNGIADLESRQMPVLRYCTCFINEVGEDKRYWTEEMAKRKMDDWLEEGIEFKSFFLLSLNMVRGLNENYNNHIQSTSQANKL